MTARAASGIYWVSIGVAAICVLFGLWSSLFGGVGIDGVLLFYLMIAASIYPAGNWLFWADPRA
jgi:hypothetical protein